MEKTKNLPSKPGTALQLFFTKPVFSQLCSPRRTERSNVQSKKTGRRQQVAPWDEHCGAPGGAAGRCCWERCCVHRAAAELRLRCVPTAPVWR